MSLEANDLLLFARVVDEGSFSRAAERLGLPKSTVSRRVAALEAPLGRAPAPAHHAQAHRDRLRPRGARARAPRRRGRRGRRVARARTARREPSGRLRVSMPSDFANLVLAPVLAAFVAALPDDRARGRPVRALRRSRRRELRRGDPHGRPARRRDARRAARSPRSAGASTRRRPTSRAAARRREPEALMEHDALRVLGRTGEPMPWILHPRRGSAGKASRPAARPPIRPSS